MRHILLITLLLLAAEGLAEDRLTVELGEAGESYQYILVHVNITAENTKSGQWLTPRVKIFDPEGNRKTSPSLTRRRSRKAVYEVKIPLDDHGVPWRAGTYSVEADIVGFKPELRSNPERFKVKPRSSDDWQYVQIHPRDKKRKTGRRTEDGRVFIPLKWFDKGPFYYTKKSHKAKMGRHPLDLSRLEKFQKSEGYCIDESYLRELRIRVGSSRYLRRRLIKVGKPRRKFH